MASYELLSCKLNRILNVETLMIKFDSSLCMSKVYDIQNSKDEYKLIIRFYVLLLISLSKSQHVIFQMSHNAFIQSSLLFHLQIVPIFTAAIINTYISLQSFVAVIIN